MIVGGVSLIVDDSITAIRMNWRIQLEAAELSDAFTPQSTTDSARGRLPPPDSPPSYKREKGQYWSKQIVKWLIQQASPFWSTIHSGGTVGMAASAYVTSRIWQATGGRVVKWAAKQTLKQMVMKPALGTVGVTASYFAAVAVLGHDIYVMLENNAEKTKMLGQGLDLGGGAGGFGG